jgi:hypothetical protein
VWLAPNLSGKNFAIPEQAVLLLQQAFEAMADHSSAPKQCALKEEVDKGKAVIEVEATEKTTKQNTMARCRIATNAKQGSHYRCVSCKYVL